MTLNPWNRFWQWLAARRLRRHLAASLPRTGSRAPRGWLRRTPRVEVAPRRLGGDT